MPTTILSPYFLTASATNSGWRTAADNDARNAECEHRLDVLHRADAAAELDRRAGLADDLLDHAVIGLRAVLRRVQIDHVDERRACLEETARGLDRIFRHLMCRAVVAFLQAHALSVLQIDCRNYLHFPTSVSFAKLRSI